MIVVAECVGVGVGVLVDFRLVFGEKEDSLSRSSGHNGSRLCVGQLQVCFKEGPLGFSEAKAKGGRRILAENVGAALRSEGEEDLERFAVTAVCWRSSGD